MKILSKNTLLGQQGINLIEKRVQEMGYWWYPSTVAEVGIDGHIEIRDPQTGEMKNLILQVQSKATEGTWSREREDSFDFICDEEDLQYWLAGTAEVLLVMSRPSKEEAYWVPVKEYFRANPQNREARRVSVSKEKGRFDKDAAGALLRLAAPSADSDDVDGPFRRDVNKVGAQRRWYLNDASDYSHGQEFSIPSGDGGVGKGRRLSPLPHIGN